MSYGIIDDGDEIHIRARITQRWELAELILKLQARVDGMPGNITTVISEPGKGTTTFYGFDAREIFDAQDVNQRELKNE